MIREGIALNRKQKDKNKQIRQPPEKVRGHNGRNVEIATKMRTFSPSLNNANNGNTSSQKSRRKGDREIFVVIKGRVLV